MRVRRNLCVGLFLLLCAPLGAAAQVPGGLAAPDLQMPAWTYCAPAGSPQMACFDQAGVQQLLRLQAAAQYGVRLNELRLTLEDRTAALIHELEGAQASYAALQAVIMERNTGLAEQLAEARADAERYRGRLERRRIWPWVTLGLGLVGGAVFGRLVAR